MRAFHNWTRSDVSAVAAAAAIAATTAMLKAKQQRYRYAAGTTTVSDYELVDIIITCAVDEKTRDAEVRSSGVCHFWQVLRERLPKLSSKRQTLSKETGVGTSKLANAALSVFLILIN